MNYNLNNKIEVWDKVECENELGEIEHKFAKIKNIWSYVVPTGGTKKDNSAEIKIKVIIRKLSLKEINNSMYFIYNKQRFNIDYHLSRFDNSDFIEVYCTLVVE